MPTHTPIDAAAETKTFQDRLLAYLAKDLLDDDVRQAGFYSTLDLENDGFYYWKSSKWARERTDDHLVKYGPLTKESIAALITNQGAWLTPELLTSLENGEIRMWLHLSGMPEEPGKLGLHWVTQTKEDVLNHREPTIEKEDQDLRLTLTTYLNNNNILTPCNKDYPTTQFGNLDGYYLNTVVEREGSQKRRRFYLRGVQDLIYQFPFGTKDLMRALEAGEAKVDIVLEDEATEAKTEEPRISPCYKGPMTGKHVAWKIQWPVTAAEGPKPSADANAGATGWAVKGSKNMKRQRKDKQLPRC
ncbi:hypothetical protein L211DRAFT_867590 [Terfezia boudieri ATCC MYA-4762]|uniref:Uncharacterized protein n=1 Tax=Terfezia boudieri ATCC MYA-4762 TaxID=1051890 RepID=A0A3N4LVK0_9PEZI|nr:hypothetical protein L211DRAFT_867590 [Terfezia boudieri ATCC MYA-4762]